MTLMLQKFVLLVPLLFIPIVMVHYSLVGNRTSHRGWRLSSLWTAREQGNKDCDLVSTLRRTPERSRVFEVVTCGSLLQRVAQFNVALDRVREKLLRDRADRDWNGTTLGTVETVWGADDDFMEQLDTYTQVKTLVLPWVGTRAKDWSSLSDHDNLLIHEYYWWTASDPLCTWVETPGALKHKYGIFYNHTCNRNMNSSVRAESLRPIILNMKPINGTYFNPPNNALPQYFYHSPPPHVFYVHIMEDAIPTDLGNVYSGNLQFIPNSCLPSRYPPTPDNVSTRPLYNELFVITQHWGTSVYHRMAEIVPRLGGSLDFLKRNPQIKILCPEGPGGRLGEYFKILGLSEDRMVTEWGRAKVVYLPRVSICGNPNVQESQIVAIHFRRYVVKHLQALTRNKLILIRRTGERRFTEQLAIEAALKTAARDYQLDFVMFIDNPTPSLNDTMRLFHAAVLVVGPHGAGLGNVAFSQPGTYVVEGVCKLPHVNLCFQRGALIHGHRWHGLASRGGCEEGVIDVAARDIERAVRVYLEQRKQAQH